MSKVQNSRPPLPLGSLDLPSEEADGGAVQLLPYPENGYPALLKVTLPDSEAVLSTADIRAMRDWLSLLLDP